MEEKKQRYTAYQLMAIDPKPGLDYRKFEIPDKDATTKQNILARQDLYEKQLLTASPEDRGAHAMFLGMLLHAQEAKAYHDGQYENKKNKGNAYSLWGERLNQLKKEEPDSKVTYNARKLFWCRGLAVVFAVLAAVVLFVPPVSRLMQSALSLVIELAFLALGVLAFLVASFLGAAIVLGVMLVVLDMLPQYVAGLSPFWSRWLGPLAVAVPLLIAALVLYWMYKAEKKKKNARAAVKDQLTEHYNRVVDVLNKMLNLGSMCLAEAEQVQERVAQMQAAAEKGEAVSGLDGARMQVALMGYATAYYVTCRGDYKKYLDQLKHKIDNP